MGLLGKLFKGGLGEAVEKVGTAVDKIITNDQERLDMKNKFTDIMASFQMQYQEELTKRHEADMNSDSWWSKNIRPLSLAYLIVVITVLAVTDGNIGQYEIRESYIKLFEGLLMMAFAFYFGSRGMEKIMESVGKYKMRKGKRRRRNDNEPE